ncbi:MAG: preprotein translocase subunit SecA [bacterium]|nr:preprotein translocase subunit SecA [bacterium]MDZ4285291.1 preprotein translocase subunit SecA [Patescibacteria group bacterium]
MSLLKTLFGGDTERRVRAEYASRVERINTLEETYRALGEADFAAQTALFRERLERGEALGSLLPEAFAVAREAARRTLGQRHFDVQLIGGIAMHEGKIAEMKTGEGKTLVATLPSYLNALPGRGVHIVTVNDYLARRDAVWMGQIHHLLGLSVGCITSDASYLYDPLHRSDSANRAGGISNFQFPISNQIPNSKKQISDSGDALDEERDIEGYFRVVHEFLRPVSRREAYAADITYGTNSEFGFDYLRDNTALAAAELRQRGHVFAIVDEIDSVLIDEARTPLIISMQVAESERLYDRFAAIARDLIEGEDYTLDEKFRSIALTESGIEKAERALGVGSIYTDAGIAYVHHLETAVRARALYQKDREYVVRDGEVIIVDEFTGRMLPSRRWSEGLHQAVEAKEGVRVKEETRTAASVTYQNYFRMYEKLAGMTGTAFTSAEEFYKVYGLEVVAVPTNQPIARADRNDLIFQTERGKFRAIAQRVKELHERGQPVLIGTVSIEKNELLSAHLKQAGVPHEILNAKNHEREGEIIAEAGGRGSVTVATNMAGRGVDIKLGGAAASPEAAAEIKSFGGLFVLGTERHEARRIDNQLRGRAGRQGDPGETEFYISLEDTLMRVFASDMIKNMMGRFGIPEDEPIENKLISRALESAQTKIEGFHFDARKRILEYDDVLNKQRQAIYARRHTVLEGSAEELRGLLDEVVGEGEELAGSLQTKREEFGEEQFFAALRRLMLQTVDYFWMQHLEVMDYMRSSVGLRAYGQRDPLVEYKKEGTRLFREMLAATNDHIAELLPHLAPQAFALSERAARAARSRIQLSGGGVIGLADTARELAGEVVQSAPTPTFTREVRLSPQAALVSRLGAQRGGGGKTNVGRNDPCPCGAKHPDGRPIKYKHCHGKDA